MKEWTAKIEVRKRVVGGKVLGDGLRTSRTDRVVANVQRAHRIV